MVYDGESRLTSYSKAGVTTSYGYDGDGRRVRKVESGVVTVFVYNASGQMMAEYSSGSVSGQGGVSYLTADHLGSTRVVTDGNGEVRARRDYLPFGEEIGTDKGGRDTAAGYVNSDTTRQKFTSKERDNESGLDYFGARYYSSAQGRFTGVDPENYQARLTPSDPQSWNAYAYTNNNPLRRVDPDGKGWWEKFKNWARGEGWRTNAEVEQRYQALEQVTFAFSCRGRACPCPDCAKHNYIIAL
jgi:RHS repeat-associated protein